MHECHYEAWIVIELPLICFYLGLPLEEDDLHSLAQISRPARLKIYAGTDMNR